MRQQKIVILAAAIACLASPALAHPGHGEQAGFLLGVMHPLTGLDHILAMVCVGLLAANLGGKALWLIPASFVGMMIVGAGLGFAGAGLPYSEGLIALSVFTLGALIAMPAQWPVGAIMGLCGVFAIFHGYAHGMELPAKASAISFAIGFVAATLALHLLGIGLGLSMARLPAAAHKWTTRLGGSAVAVTGLALLAS